MSQDRAGNGRGWRRRVRLDPAHPLPVAWRRAGLLVLAWLASLVLYLVLRVPVGELPARAVGIFFFAAVCWSTEVIPLYATSFLIVAGEILLLATDGGLSEEVTRLVGWLGLPEAGGGAGGVEGEASGGEAAISAGVFLAPFARDIMFLFMGGFLLSSAVTRHGLDRVLARVMLRPFQRSPLGLLVALVGISAFWSMWMSNTATAAMLVAIVGPLLRALPATERYRTGIALAIPVGANIGGMGTPIGTPPNAIAYSALNAAGFEVSFLGWMLVAVPLVVLLLAGAVAVLWALHGPSRSFEMPSDVFGGAEGEGKGWRSITPMGRVTLVVMVLAVLGWLTGDVTGISPGVVALICAALLTATRTLDRRDVDSIDWNVLILIWGGLSLSVALEVSGLAEMLTGVDFGRLAGGTVVVGAVVGMLALGLSTFMSNTATAGLLVPMALALSMPERAELAIVAALSCSLAMAMPVSTPPNAIAFASGAIPLRAMIRVGVVVGVVSLVILLAGYRFVLPLGLDLSGGM
ncbi:MAG: SLC13 family permease [Phycisphaerales bacterium]